MSVISKFWKRINRTTLYSAKNPKNFNELWGVKTTPLRMFSLVVAVIVAFIFMGAFWVAPYFVPAQSNQTTLRKELQRIGELEAKLSSQEQYIDDIKIILTGGVAHKVNKDIAVSESSINTDSINSAPTESEKKIAIAVNDNSSKQHTIESSVLTYFASPVQGVISQPFSTKHFGIDIVAKTNTSFKSCLDGTVIYSGYSINDGKIIIVKHANNFISVYKHAKSIFKKTGDKVDIGDPLGVVGDSGENSTGPHLHFEIWQNQKAVNPENFLVF